MTTFFFWTLFAVIIVFAVLVSLVRGVLTHVTGIEIELLRKSNPRTASLFDTARAPEKNLVPALGVLYSAAAGLSAALGGILVGREISLMQEELGQLPVWLWPCVLFGLLLAALIVTSATGLLPRKLGGHFRHFFMPRLAGPARLLLFISTPLRRFASRLDRLAPPVNETRDSSDDEIREIAQKNLREGKLTKEESTLVENAVRLDDISVKEIMTPRSVVTALDAKLSIAEVFRQIPNMPHGRFPVYDKTLDNVTGIVRRRDLLQAKAQDRDSVLVGDLADKAHCVPEGATVGAALRDLVVNHRQLAVVVDEFGSISGVVTLEDIFENLIGAEIFEKDDIAVDMRALARSRRKSRARK